MRGPTIRPANPLLHPERSGRTFAELVLELKARGRTPDEPWRPWARSRPRLPNKGGKPARYPDAERGALAIALSRYMPAWKATREARRRSARPWNPAVVRELVELVRPLARSDTEAWEWVGDFLGGLVDGVPYSLSYKQVGRLARPKPNP